MLKVVVRPQERIVMLDDVEEKYKGGCIVAAENADGSIYKLTSIEHGPNSRYAFVSLDGRAWFFGSESTVKREVDKTMKCIEGNVYVFETWREYVQWLNQTVE
jgi:hypothetical protein